MKKSLLFAAFAAFAMCAQAQDPAEWTLDAATLEIGTYSEDFTSGIYTFVCNGKTWEIDANTARFSNDSTVQYTQRVKAKSKNNSIRIEAPQAGTLIFGARTGSNSATDRTLVAKQNGVELYNAVVQEADTMEHVYGETPKAYLTTNVAVPAAGTVEVTMPAGNLNYYFIQFTTGEVVNPDTPDTPETPDTPDTPDTPVVPADGNIFDPAVVGENTFDANYEYGIYTLVVVDAGEDTKPWVLDANKATYDYDTTVQHTHRIKSGNTHNYFTVNAPTAGELLICPRSGNKDAADRNVIVEQGGVELLNQIVKDADAVDKVYPAYKVNVPTAGVVTISNPTGAMNYYYISFSQGGTGVKHTWDASKPFICNNRVAAAGAEKVYVYNVLGRLVRTANAEEVDLNDMARGIYVVKAVYADGKAQTVKVRR